MDNVNSVTLLYIYNKFVSSLPALEECAHEESQVQYAL